MITHTEKKKKRKLIFRQKEKNLVAGVQRQRMGHVVPKLWGR